MFIRRIDISKDAEMDPRVRQSMLVCGGIGLMTCGKDTSFQDWHDALPSVCRDAGLTADARFTFVLEELTSYLNDAEMEAMLSHEEGHYVLGHLDGFGSGVLLDVALEDAADDYAADKVGAAALISALNSMRRFVFDVIYPELFPELAEMPPELHQILADRWDLVMLPRIARLKARG